MRTTTATQYQGFINTRELDNVKSHIEFERTVMEQHGNMIDYYFKELTYKDILQTKNNHLIKLWRSHWNEETIKKIVNIYFNLNL